MVQDAGTRLKPSPHISFLLSFLLSLRLSRLPSPPLRSLPRSRSTWGPFAACALAVASSTSLAACAPDEVRLHAPEIAGSKARESPAKVELEPMVMGAGVTTAIESGESIAQHPDPSAVLTAGIRDELAGRALRGGEPGGYDVKCTLDRFAVRVENGVTRRLATLYADAQCDVVRAADSRVAWRGEIRGRACTREASSIERGSPGVQRMIDRMMSDAAREMASDLLVRVLGLTGVPSARAFEDEQQQKEIAGIDDGDLGTAALAERILDRAALDRALADRQAPARAAAWNVVAMSVGPGDAWPLGDTFVPDGTASVRFYQYKALAREASAATLVQLEEAAAGEKDALLLEMARDSLASGGIAFPRSPRAKANTVTNGTTTSP